MSGSAFAEPHRGHRHGRDQAPGRSARPVVSVTDASVVEPPAGTTTNATFTVSLSSAPARPMWLVVYTRNGTARRQDGDYDFMMRLLRFDRRSPLSQTVDVRVRGDAVDEGVETFRVLARAEGVFADATGTIQPPAAPDQGPPPPPPPPPPTVALHVTGASVVEPASGGLSDGTVSVGLAAPLDHDVTVSYQLVGVSASAGSDFLADSGTLVFPAGSTASQDIVVTVVGDDVIEPDETFEVRFSSAGVTLDPSAATVTILDDDSGNNGPVIDPQ
jgi:hypothetical protein